MLAFLIQIVLYAVIALGLYGVVHMKTKITATRVRRETLAAVARTNKRMYLAEREAA